MIQLFTQFALVDQLCQTDGFAAVDQAEGDVCIRFIAKNRLTHQKLVEICINQGPDDRVDLPFVVPDARCDVDHVDAPLSALSTAFCG
jgi:hypothetical protein